MKFKSNKVVISKLKTIAENYKIKKIRTIKIRAKSRKLVHNQKRNIQFVHCF